MTLLDDSFKSIANAVMWGRSLYRNLQRFIFFQLVVNVTALLLVLTAAAFAGSLFGFGDLIGTVYPVYGYLGMAAMLLAAEHAVHARRAGNDCAATGD